MKFAEFEKNFAKFKEETDKKFDELDKRLTKLEICANYVPFREVVCKLLENTEEARTKCEKITGGREAVVVLKNHLDKLIEENTTLVIRAEHFGAEGTPLIFTHGKSKS
jgi:hypothetical protein